MIVKDENFAWLATEEKREGFVDVKIEAHNVDEGAHPALAQEMRDALESHSENQDENGARHVTAQDVEAWNKAASDSSEALDTVERYREQAEDAAAELADSVSELQAGLDAAKAKELYYGDENIVPTDPSFFTYADHGDGTCAISGITEGCPTDIVIPYEIDGMTVVGINYGAFSNKQIRSVIMPDTIVSIGQEAFFDCGDLAYVRLSNNLEKIEANAFVATSALRTLTIPDSVTHMGDYVFMDFGAGYNVTIWCNKGSYAETYAIDYNIPYEYIDAKDYADKIVTEPITKTNALYYYDDISAVPTSPSFLKYIEWEFVGNGEVLWAIIGDVDDAITDVVLPYEIDGMKVTHIFDYAFCGSKLRSVIMPNTITSISVNTFNYCSNLSCVRLSSKLKSIDANAFVGLPNLHTLVIPDSVVSIGEGVFAECPNLTIMCSKGSYAESYAIENNIPYEYLDAKDYIGDMSLLDTDDKEDVVSAINGVKGEVLDKIDTHSHTPESIGAIPNTVTIPSRTSQLENDSGYIKQNDVSEALDEIDGALKKTKELQNDVSGALEEIDGVVEKAEELQNNIGRAISDMQNQYSNALKAKASGEVIRVDDVSPVAHNPAVRVQSKNLIPISLLDNPNYNSDSANYITYDATTHTIAATIEAPNNSRGIYVRPEVFAIGETYTLSVNLRGTAGKKVIIAIGNKKTVVTLTEEYTRVSVVAVASRTNEAVAFYNEITEQGGLAVGDWMQFDKVQLELGDTATEYTPYVSDLTTVAVTRYGKNLMRTSLLNNMSVSGTSFSYDNTNHIITMSEDNTTSNFMGVNIRVGGLVANKTYTVSFDIRGTAGKKCRAGWDRAKQLVTLTENYVRYSKALTVPETNPIICFYTNLTSEGGLATGEWMQFDNVQIELSETATEFEPYKEPIEYTVNADGTANEVKSIYPNMTLMADKSGVVMDAEYNKDANKVIEKLTNAIISLGGNV